MPPEITHKLVESPCARLYKRGVSYHDAAELMLRQVQHHAFQEQNASAVGQWMYPTVTNYAFACELYLKSLFYTEYATEHPHSHNLKMLFEELPEAIKSELVDLCASTSNHFDHNQFHKQLRINKLVFETYRYPTEGRKSSLVFLQVFGGALKGQANQRHSRDLSLVTI